MLKKQKILEPKPAKATPSEPEAGHEQIKEEKETPYSRLRLRLELIYDGDEVIYSDLCDRIKLYAPIIGRDPEEVIQKIIELKSEPGIPVQAFVDGASLELFDWVEFQNNHPDKAEELDREYFMKKEGNIPLSKLMYANFHEDPSVIHIHIAPGETLPDKEVQNEVIAGIGALAKYVTEHAEVQTISATSWIVEKFPAMFRRNGFTLGPADSATVARELSYENRPIKTARASRDSFLDIMKKRNIGQ